MNAAFNGHRPDAHSGITHHVYDGIAPKTHWLWALVLLLFLSACTNSPSTVPTVAVVPPGSHIAVEPPQGQPGPLSRLIADSVVAALNQRGFPARIADSQPARFVITGHTETLDAQYAPMVAALSWTLNDGSGTEIAYLNQRVSGERSAWAYGSPAMLQTIGQQTAADLSPFLGTPVTASGAPVTEPAMTEDTTTQASSSTDQTLSSTQETSEQLAHSSDLVPAVSNQAFAVPEPPVVPPPPVTGGDRGLVDFGIWVDEVTGAPGDGNRALTKALLAELKRAALPFAMSPGTASHFVQGVVDVTVLDNTTEHVTILWAVSNGDGKELGRITQRNNIARGTLHQTWGNTAQYAAIGGAEAVLAIIERDFSRN